MIEVATNAVLARNDRYVIGLVEEHGVCPFARTCRTTERLWRAICWADRDDVERIIAMTETLEQVTQPVEVALLLLPGMREMTAREFDALHQRLRTRYQDRAGGASYYVVPFHPDYPVDDRDAGTLVRFWRKSPDPTLQFVHIDTLEALRREDPREGHNKIALSMFGEGRSAEEVLEALSAAPVKQSTSALVAVQNFARFADQGAQPFEQAMRLAQTPALPQLQASWVDTAWRPATGSAPAQR